MSDAGRVKVVAYKPDALRHVRTRPDAPVSGTAPGQPRGADLGRRKSDGGLTVRRPGSAVTGRQGLRYGASGGRGAERRTGRRGDGERGGARRRGYGGGNVRRTGGPGRGRTGGPGDHSRGTGWCTDCGRAAGAACGRWCRRRRGPPEGGGRSRPSRPAGVLRAPRGRASWAGLGGAPHRHGSGPGRPDRGCRAPCRGRARWTAAPGGRVGPPPDRGLAGGVRRWISRAGRGAGRRGSAVPRAVHFRPNPDPAPSRTPGQAPSREPDPDRARPRAPDRKSVV